MALNLYRVSLYYFAKMILKNSLHNDFRNNLKKIEYISQLKVENFRCPAVFN